MQAGRAHFGPCQALVVRRCREDTQAMIQKLQNAGMLESHVTVQSRRPKNGTRFLELTVLLRESGAGVESFVRGEESAQVTRDRRTLAGRTGIGTP